MIFVDTYDNIVCRAEHLWYNLVSVQSPVARIWFIYIKYFYSTIKRPIHTDFRLKLRFNIIYVYKDFIVKKCNTNW